MALNPMNVLDVSNRQQFRAWLEGHHASEAECWVDVRRGRPVEGTFCYLDAVEEALCFGWIDSTVKPIEGVTMQRFGPRKPRSPWSELNKERVRRLEKLGMMTDAGRDVLPPMGPRSFRIDPQVERDLKAAKVWGKFRSFPPLYQRIRAYNLAFRRSRSEEEYARTLANVVAHTKRGEMYGEWNDFGRLLDY